MTKLKKKQEKERDALVARLNEQAEAINAAITKYNETLAEAKEFAQGIVGEIEDYVSERSDAWHESDKASAVEDWKTAWEGIADYDDVEEFENEAATALEDCATEADG